MTDELTRENQRLARRVARLEMSLTQVEQIRDGNAQLLNRLMDDLDVERQRSRDLLLNVLPARIVARLDEGETNIADRHDFVAVVMTDLVGFTPSAAQLTAADLVAELNDLFTRFDAACARRGVEKIKTIGDAYMAVAGLDRDDSTASRASVTSAASLALDMFEALVTSGARWQMRIGIHAGPVVAGVIGTRKFAYDVWGDTVNVASRLESTSQPGRIQVSKVVADALESDFLLEPRGKVDLKGKGQTATWFLVGHR
ncbi:MAG TPA: adenylate/guanylate cyclase domain-containing protein [Candidatus Limnocylindrales bacterium]